MNERLLKLVLGMLSLVLLALIGTGVYLVVTDRGHFTLSPQQTATPSPSPSKTATGNETVALMKVPVPADSACKECHKSDQVNVVNVPIMGHQLIGWEKCKACHGKDKLVPTAPGHRGIHQEYCTMCHQPRPADLPAALPRPHHQYPGKLCIDCHKVGGPGPLPEQMMKRKNCWTCHISSENEDLFEAQVPS